MKPVLTPQEMREVDRLHVERGGSVDVLIERAGWAVAREARRIMGGVYGRRVVVVAGKGNNGADGRVAARLLERAGVRVSVLDAESPPAELPAADLVIDAAYGTGFRGHWNPPRATAPVLAVDIPSGLDGLTGCAHGEPWAAVTTVTFAALKPGLLLADGPRLSGRIVVADIGLAVVDRNAATVDVVEAPDVAAWLSPRPVDAHKWRSGVFVLAGGPGMVGAARLASLGSLRSGAGMVHLAIPGTASDRAVPTEVVRRSLPLLGWSTEIESIIAERFRAVVIGPGLGRDQSTSRETSIAIANSPLATVVDGDGLWALGEGESAVRILASRRASTVVTPHDGEFARLNGGLPSPDRIDAVRTWASRAHVVCVLKGPRTIVASPDGRVLMTDNADERLATAGTGDVLSGVIGALLARGIDPFHAAAAGAWIHAEASRRGPRAGFIAGDLPDLLPEVFVELEGIRR
ncbi:MAG: hypothetical protein RL391_1324 [Actinomycetota bacterium]|jgi:NAD(P)H-hydrate epimerase